MEKIELKDLGECQVVEDLMLTSMTSEGWQLVAILDEPGWVNQVEEAVNPKYDPNDTGYNNQRTIPINKIVPQTTYRYVVAAPKDETINKLAANASRLQVELRQQETLTDSLRADVEALKKRNSKVDADVVAMRLSHEEAVKKLQDSNIRIEDQYQQATDELVVGAKQLDAAEAQLEKIWRALGDLQMKQILGKNVANPIPGGLPPTAYERISSDDEESFGGPQPPDENAATNDDEDVPF